MLLKDEVKLPSIGTISKSTRNELFKATRHRVKDIWAKDLGKGKSRTDIKREMGNRE